ncbi:hypothetical protein FT663_00768 [Candidozyma haemuli var. vulneris]|uniref:EXS domain-containing protein n=1 Tax=Candidozyma haemuli TaxID=45357 RepID=A0A2V1AWT6_9ASCO|nr:hypothetical protein CXQ85_005299 [[Candida] haemuloni]KAF3992858.1 hypothetical protein FT662_00860 [[Candida] haemuloni var. vulneris]KAF3995069.1 hypothetical protein FT663_00768 [[Candida] haemuloni var. vulneris]PVH22272.1 hypothetical protein CXQ85_005299 [[Candida] haemuloni]
MSFDDLKLNDIIPLPFRILLLVQFGIHLWYTLVWYCYKVHGINVLALLNLSYSPHKYPSISYIDEANYGEFATSSVADLSENQHLVNGINRNIKVTLLANVSGLFFYWCSALFVDDDSKAFWFFRAVSPTILMIHTLYRFFLQRGTIATVRINTTVKRILFGDINSSTMRTNDILLSDSLISYAKVINDWGMFVWKTYIPTESNYNAELETFMLSMPALIRMKQCWYEYSITKQRQHLFNFLKYSMSLGPVIINLLIKLKMTQLTEDADVSAQLNVLNRWWYFLSTISASYSFFWDVKMDWGFSMFDILLHRRGSHWVLLREPNKLVYNNTIAYFTIIGLDFVLRFIWVLKLFVIKETEVRLGLKNKVGNFLFGLDFLSLGYALLEFLEIVRRWLWCFLKLESDLVKLQYGDTKNAIPLASVKIG